MTSASWRLFALAPFFGAFWRQPLSLAPTDPLSSFVRPSARKKPCFMTQHFGTRKTSGATPPSAPARAATLPEALAAALLAPVVSIVLMVLVAGCASPGLNAGSTPPTAALGPATPQPQGPAPNSWRAVDVLLLGEQHDATAHQQKELQVVQQLASESRLAALALEMAEEGTTTIALARNADEADVQKALQWSDAAWPWRKYGPVVMAAVRAGVPVVGANLPKSLVRTAMVDVSLDAQLGANELVALQQAVRAGHCNLVPEPQIVPMTRVQIARDRAMGHRVAESVVPGKVVVLVAGAGHIHKQIGVPQHVPVATRVQSLLLLAGDTPPSGAAEAYDTIWRTPAVTPVLPAIDRCAEVKR